MGDSRSGAMVSLTTDDGQTFQAYVAGPEDAERAVLIFHEWWGLKDHNREWADTFAKKGYRCIALDMYDGRITDNAEEAGHWMKDLDQQLVDTRIRAVLEQLHAGKRPVATLGYSMGGKQALRTALIAPKAVSATVVGYCRLETDSSKLKPLMAPVFVVYAEQEQSWPKKQEEFESVMEKLGKPTVSLSFNAAHGFTNPSSERYDPDAASSAWKATMTFLETHLN